MLVSTKLQILRILKVQSTGILAPLPEGGFPEIRELSLPGASLPDEDLARLVAACPNLMTLDISGTSAGQHTAGALRKCAQLKALNISNCAGMTKEILTGLLQSVQLMCVNLERTKWMSKENLTALANSEKWPFEATVSDFQVWPSECEEISRATRKCVTAK